MNLRGALIALGLLVLAGSTTSCDSGAEAVDSRQPFIAFLTDFKGFHSWTSHDSESTIATGAAHTGPKRTYINKMPESGADEFPVGTIIVKEGNLDKPEYQDHQVFAMVKRGGEFNSTGADGWEWFELLLSETGDVYSVEWRGVGPPLLGGYGSDPNSGCNECHVRSRANDFVQDTFLQLDDL